MFGQTTWRRAILIQTTMRRMGKSDGELEALMDQCLDIRVQLSVALGNPIHEPTTVAALLGQLADLEERIRKRLRGRLPRS